MRLMQALAQLLLEEGCSLSEEAEGVAEAIVAAATDNDPGGEDAAADGARFNSHDDTSIISWPTVIEHLTDYFDLDTDEAGRVVEKLKKRVKRDDDGSTSTSSDDGEERDAAGRTLQEVSSSDDGNDGDDSDGRDFLAEGECELCDRFMKLTKHHLVPKSTWPKISVRLLRAADALEEGDPEKARVILGDGMADLSSRLSSSPNPKVDPKVMIRKILRQTCEICRQCHSTVHFTHNNMDLALFYNTVDKLLDDPQIAKYCKWASKQRTGQYTKR